MQRFDNRTVMVLGASSGIGRQAAILISEMGGTVVAVSSNKKKLDGLAAELHGRDHVFIVCDLSNPCNVKDLFDSLGKRRLWGLIYSAGVAPLLKVSENSPEEMERVFAINVFSFIEAVKFFSEPTISEDGARVVAVSSVTARAAGNRQVLYGSSKAALTASVKLMARELLNRGIHVNCLTLAVTDTPMLDSLRKSSNLDKIPQLLGLIPVDVAAKAAVSLLSGGADYRTGSEVLLEAGYNLL